MKFNFEDLSCDSPKQFKSDIQTTYGIFGCIEPDIKIRNKHIENCGAPTDEIFEVYFDIFFELEFGILTKCYVTPFPEALWGKPFSDETIKELRQRFMLKVLKDNPYKQRQPQDF